MNWHDIDKAAMDGSLDKADLPFLFQCRQELDRLANAGDAAFQRVRQTLRNRVGEIIKIREDENLLGKQSEEAQKRHEEIAGLNRKAVEISEEANRISKAANIISSDANKISRGAKGEARIATGIALAALIFSGFQLFLDWHYKSATVNPSEFPAQAQLKIELKALSTNSVRSSNNLNATSTNNIPLKK